ncbi:MAG: metallophosphoesterase family protein [Planctomycetota bacterium]
MSKSPIAVMADIHGNRWALEAVLEDIRGRGIRRIVNLGDSLYGPLDPAGTARMLLSLDIPTVRGNEDRIIVGGAGELESSATLRYVRACLSPDVIRWLARLKMTAVAYGDFRMCHGSLDRDDEYLLEEVTESGVRPISSDQLAMKLATWHEPVLLFGHSHVPRTVRLDDNRLIVTPGSVGLQAFADDVPTPHVMETGSPHARYSVVSKGDGRWSVEAISVVYDWEAAAKTAQEHGRSDWATWLRTGLAT